MTRCSNKKRIYVDLDDVISRTTDTYVSIIESEFGKKARFEDILSFNLQESFDLNDNEYDHFFNLIHTPEILMGFEPVDGATDTLAKFKELGWEIDVVTGRPASALDISLSWLKTHHIPFSSFIIVDKYSRQGQHMDVAISKKDLACRPYDFAVEDSFDMACFLASTMNVQVALFDRPWNCKETCNKKIKRFFTWKEIESHSMAGQL
ncbi:MAG: bifunctional metallophosphatase/5'-nucleotidase [Desulfobacteraceae bacterium]|nr:bifunctional metallophosphatase/5'-nucleotidase [Desulfobacteraceae bacterium]